MLLTLILNQSNKQKNFPTIKFSMIPLFIKNNKAKYF